MDGVDPQLLGQEFFHLSVEVSRFEPTPSLLGILPYATLMYIVPRPRLENGNTSRFSPSARIVSRLLQLIKRMPIPSCVYQMELRMVMTQVPRQVRPTNLKILDLMEGMERSTFSGNQVLFETQVDRPRQWLLFLSQRWVLDEQISF